MSAKFKPSRGKRVKKLNNWHEALSDWLIANPGKPLRHAAFHFDVTQGWLSSVLNSDLFKAYHSKRRDEHATHVSVDTQDRLRGLTDAVLESLTEKIEQDKLAPGELRETASMALKASGFGMPKANKPSVQILNMNGVDQQTLAESRKLMQQRKAEIIEEDVQDAKLPAAS